MDSDRAADPAPSAAMRERLPRLHGSATWPRAASATACAIVVGLAPLWLVPGIAAYFDWPLHLFWIQAFSQQVAHGVLYPHWIAAANGGYGSPAFVFYGPLAYWIAAGAIALGASPLVALKFVYSVAVAIGAAGAAWWYRAIDARMAPALAGAAALSPAALMLVYRFNMPAAALAAAFAVVALGVVERARDRCGIVPVGVSFAFVVLAHLPTASMSGAAIALLVLPGVGTREGRLRAGIVGGGIALGLALSAFYWLPAVWELRYVHAETLLGGALDWRRNLLFDATLPAAERARGNGRYLETFAICLVAAMLATWLLAECSSRIGSSGKIMVRRFGLVALALLAFTTPLGDALYRFVPGFAFLQFGWRWLPLFAFFAFAAITAATRGIDPASRRSALVFAAAPSLAFALSWPLVSGSGLLLPPAARTTAAQVAWALAEPRIDPPEHVPLTAKPGFARDGTPDWQTVRGTAIATPLDSSDTRRSWDVRATGDSIIRLKTLCFPGWSVRMDGIPAPTSCDRIGALRFKLPAGDHRMEQSFEPTADRYAGLLLSACALLAVIAGRARIAIRNAVEKISRRA